MSAKSRPNLVKHGGPLARSRRKSASSSAIAPVPASAAPAEAQVLHFTVDAALLRELGERLVGQPHIALAELVKNGYDADGRRVKIVVERDRLVIEDDGHGMTLDEFRDFWMRIGTSHKQQEGFSRKLRRPLTGSKGIGRLAVQFLARRLSLSTTTARDRRELIASVNWNEAVDAGDLTSATATYTIANQSGTYVQRTRHGTRIELTELNDIWDADSLAELATEIWTLQPPYGARDSKDPRSFEVTLESSDSTISAAFARRINANLDLWTARVRGHLLPIHPDDPSGTRRFMCGVQFRNAQSEKHEFLLTDCALNDVQYDIRIFSLHGRQRYGISVDEARKYLKAYGGVHIYDSGFHLPYYGPDVDWLKTEIDHSHRLSRSELLPEHLQVVEGLNNLPTLSRIYGVVEVDTASERRLAARKKKLSSGNFLEIQVSRDRLVDNKAYRQLVRMVRTALDLYAMRETARRLQSARETLKGQDVRALELPGLQQILEQNKDRLPRDLFEALRSGLDSAIAKASAFREVAAAELGLVGSLATAGITSLALEHESNKELILLAGLADEVDGLAVTDEVSRKRVGEIAASLRAWIQRTREIRAAFSPLLDEEDRSIRERLYARAVIDNVVAHTRIFTRGIPIDASGVEQQLLLPRGSMAEWSAVFQNLLINATNALLDAEAPKISLSSQRTGDRRSVLVQDNGVGVDLRHSERLFQPFAREARISAERRSLGLGGTGLGLTIVRMIAGALNAEAHFVPPDPGFSTALELSWTEESQ